ncbi:hypothetical protein SAMN05444000_10947 [Shimia gijangensis]|uniref:Uncharacterized protein n=1 Tax=Shimia gijangensis TaxID=1470563 RepID=A0A1M6JK98_9RHOB|nr:hypothetical protein [Shimia gijangensis]SHJ47089.1 hypothetical protein SAMN05444000_10947 [Shimia gijangensis]
MKKLKSVLESPWHPISLGVVLYLIPFLPSGVIESLPDIFPFSAPFGGTIFTSGTLIGLGLANRAWLKRTKGWVTREEFELNGGKMDAET